MAAAPKISRAKVALLAAGVLAALGLVLALALHRAGDGEKSILAGCPLRAPGAELRSCYAQVLLSMMEERRIPQDALATIGGARQGSLTDSSLILGRISTSSIRKGPPQPVIELGPATRSTAAYTAS